MSAFKVKDHIWALIQNYDDEDLELFEGLWPIPHGVTVNAYLVQGTQGAALIDPSFDLLEDLADTGTALTDIKYIIVNHTEPDHSSWVPQAVQLCPGAQVFCTAKAAVFLEAFYGVKNFQVVKDGQDLDLGGGLQLKFFEMPNLHWPETMFTYEVSTGVLFSCDAFGGYGEIEDQPFDDTLSGGEKDFFLGESLRYYSNIIGGLSSFVIKALDKWQTLNLPIHTVAPSHGLIWRGSPSTILDAYRKFAGYMDGTCEPEITLIWGSMYGNTKALVDTIISAVQAEKVDLNIFQVPQDHYSFILPAAFRSKGLILGMPTYEYKMFPPMAHFLDMCGRKHIWHKDVLRFGSFGWSGGAYKDLHEWVEESKLKWTFVEPIEYKGAPSQEILDQTFQRVREFARKIKDGN